MERKGRRSLPVELIDDKAKRRSCYTKRKAGLMKKAYELHTLTGAHVMLLVATSDGDRIYNYTSPKLKPIISEAPGHELISRLFSAAQEDPPPPTAAAPWMFPDCPPSPLLPQ